ncbi:MAG: response regulator [Terriglobales bacterium]|jgi:HD-like signal output (HDOD) protein
MKRILFVDDETRILDGIRRMLHADRKRWDMEFAEGGEAALKACDLGAFDVIVSDMRMPGMDGATLLTHMRNRCPATARILLSGHCDVEAATRVVTLAHRFLAKPCDPKELRAAIESVCTLQDLLSGAEIRKVIGSIGQLPSLSSTYASLAQAVNDPNTSIGKIGRIVEQDMALSAKVLQLVNSAFFGLGQNVSTVQSAVSYLGMDTIKNLVLVAETVRVFVPDKRIPPSVYEFLQQHAQRVAYIAGKLPVDKNVRDLTILAALLHDIGRLIFASKLPDQFCAITALVKERGCQVFEAEEELFGISHAEVGAFLLGLWGIPYLAVEAIAHHHHPTRTPHSSFDVPTALYIADVLAGESTTDDSTSTELRESDRDCLEKLGVLDRLPEFRELAGPSVDQKSNVAGASW